MAALIPFSPTWIKMKKHYRSGSYFKSVVEDLIYANPNISTSSRIKVETAETGLFSKPAVILRGHVMTEEEKTAILQIITDKSHGAVEARDEIEIKTDVRETN